MEIVALAFFTLSRLRLDCRHCLSFEILASADQQVGMKGRYDGRATPTERLEIHGGQLPELILVTIVGFLARVERLLDADWRVYLGYDAVAQITDTYVELYGSIGLLQILVEQSERAARRPGTIDKMCFFFSLFPPSFFFFSLNSVEHKSIREPHQQTVSTFFEDIKCLFQFVSCQVVHYHSRRNPSVGDFH